mmetsp:Transcript_32272/g.75137  ORF Transcript_32272/g.75137 Transcript_32272/m.75137 type:complete len:615 (-) Transcript_32272:260-2104(-)
MGEPEMREAVCLLTGLPALTIRGGCSLVTIQLVDVGRDLVGAHALDPCNVERDLDLIREDLGVGCGRVVPDDLCKPVDLGFAGGFLEVLRVLGNGAGSRERVEGPGLEHCDGEGVEHEGIRDPKGLDVGVCCLPVLGARVPLRVNLSLRVEGAIEVEDVKGLISIRRLDRWEVVAVDEHGALQLLASLVLVVGAYLDLVSTRGDALDEVAIDPGTAPLQLDLVGNGEPLELEAACPALGLGCVAIQRVGLDQEVLAVDGLHKVPKASQKEVAEHPLAAVPLPDADVPLLVANISRQPPRQPVQEVLQLVLVGKGGRQDLVNDLLFLLWIYMRWERAVDLAREVDPWDRVRKQLPSLEGVDAVVEGEVVEAAGEELVDKVGLLEAGVSKDEFGTVLSTPHVLGVREELVVCPNVNLHPRHRGEYPILDPLGVVGIDPCPVLPEGASLALDEPVLVPPDELVCGLQVLSLVDDKDVRDSSFIVVGKLKRFVKVLDGNRDTVPRHLADALRSIVEEPVGKDLLPDKRSVGDHQPVKDEGALAARDAVVVLEEGVELLQALVLHGAEDCAHGPGVQVVGTLLLLAVVQERLVVGMRRDLAREGAKLCAEILPPRCVYV